MLYNWFIDLFESWSPVPTCTCCRLCFLKTSQIKMVMGGGGVTTTPWLIQLSVSDLFGGISQAALCIWACAVHVLCSAESVATPRSGLFLWEQAESRYRRQTQWKTRTLGACVFITRALRLPPCNAASAVSLQHLSDAFMQRTSCSYFFAHTVTFSSFFCQSLSRRSF